MDAGDTASDGVPLLRWNPAGRRGQALGWGRHMRLVTVEQVADENGFVCRSVRRCDVDLRRGVPTREGT